MSRWEVSFRLVLCAGVRARIVLSDPAHVGRVGVFIEFCLCRKGRFFGDDKLRCQLSSSCGTSSGTRRMSKIYGRFTGHIPGRTSPGAATSDRGSLEGTSVTGAESAWGGRLPNHKPHDMICLSHRPLVRMCASARRFPGVYILGPSRGSYGPRSKSPAVLVLTLKCVGTITSKDPGQVGTSVKLAVGMGHDVGFTYYPSDCPSR